MFLLDVNAIFELRKVKASRADPNVTAWVGAIPVESLFLPIIVVREIEIGDLLAERRNPARGAILQIWLDNHVLRDFSERILPVDMAVVRRSAAPHIPDLQAVRDGLIAAIGLMHIMTVVTLNLADFVPTRVLVFDLWEPAFLI